MAERSEVTDRRAAVIVTDSDDRPTRYTTPSASPTRVGSLTSNAPSGVHRVVRGETLYSIAFQHDMDFRNLAIANNLRPPYTIFVGQQLSLDISNPGSSAVPIAANTGTMVGNNSVARSQGASTSVRGVMRQPIASSPLPATPQWQWPLRGQVLTNFQAKSGADKGIDIVAVNGQPVYAASAGDVVYAGNGIQGSGNLIIIRHNDRFLSAYAHNSAILVSEGQQIRAGDHIATAGSNQEGTPMLHFEIRMDGKPVDPMVYLPRL